MMAMVPASQPSLPPTLEVLRRVREAYAPPPDLKVSEFSERSIILTSGPLAGTRWQNSFAPYQVGIMDAFHEPGVETVVVLGSSQWGKTSIIVNLVAYHMRYDPCSVLVIEPTVEPMAKDFARNRLEPVIAASPDIAEVVSKKRGKDATNTTLQKTFRGGYVVIGGANSAASLAARAIRFLAGDEIDRWPLTLPGEGSTIAIALKRTTAYRRRRRIFLTSSPTMVGAPIHAWFERGDQRRYYVPCPECGTMHPFEWQQVRWTDNDPGTARIHCPACDHPITDAERVAILGRGEWRAEHPERLEKSIVSFHLWEAYSPLSSLSEIVTGFLRARAAQKAGDRSEMHTWQNTTLGEPVEQDEGEGIEPHAVLMRKEHYGADVDVPAGVSALTCGVDTQDDRLEALVLGWGPGDECWVIDRQTFTGDTSGPEPWQDLDALLRHEYRHACGRRMPIRTTAIDSAGHRTDFVYAFCARMALRKVYAIIGRAGQYPIWSKASPRKFGGGRPVALFTVGVDALKALLMSRLALTEAGPGYLHIPTASWADQEFAEQLTSERLKTTFERGVKREAWKKIRPRNEALDCAVYATWALHHNQPDSKRRDDWLRELLAEWQVAPRATPPPPKPKPSPWLGPRRGSWLRGR